MTTPKQIPPHNAARFKAGELIHREGAKTQEELFAAVYFGKNASTARDNLRQSIESGWLVDVAGVISCGAAATAYYKARASEVGAEKLPAPEPEPAGQKVPPRFVNVMDRPAYVPPKPFRRADTEDCSWRAIPSHFGKDLT